ncbi:hypothetical protein C8R44DRAFT_878693 [Mycena epipterygia]|nr:hypothetical protein C8R44DRAFT_878693 [Mycena epipterygia]
MFSSILVIVPFLAVINAANDWNTPCVTGQCSYGSSSDERPVGRHTENLGSENAITDITPTADWQIIDCDLNALSKISASAVRTPLRAFRNPGCPPTSRFPPPSRHAYSAVTARPLFRYLDHASIIYPPPPPPVVKALSIDTDFDAVDWTQNGKVNFGINAANVPGVATDIQVPGSRRSRRSRRGILGGLKTKIGHIGSEVTSAVGNAATKVEAGATSVLGDITSEAGNIATKVISAVGSAETIASNAINATNNIGGDKTFTIKPITFDQSKNLFNTSSSCGPVTRSLSVDMAVNATVTPSLTITVAGTFVPPDITTFKAVADLTAQISGTLTLSAELTGHISSSKITVFQAGIPGLDLPGILTLGPSFEIDAELDGDVDLTMDLAVGLNLDVNNAQLIFPPDASTADSSAFSLGNTPLKLSASPSVQATGTLTAHLIPTLNFGISALSGKGQANLFAALDTSAALVLSLDASAQISTTSTNSTTSANSTTDTNSITDTNSTAFAPLSSAVSTAAKATAVSATAIDATELPPVKNQPSASNLRPQSCTLRSHW